LVVPHPVESHPPIRGQSYQTALLKLEEHRPRRHVLEWALLVAPLPSGGTALRRGAGDNINMTAGCSVVSYGSIIAPAVVQCYYAGSLLTF
jgi:hypothetical protein